MKIKLSQKFLDKLKKDLPLSSAGEVIKRVELKMNKVYTVDYARKVLRGKRLNESIMNEFISLRREILKEKDSMES